MYAWKTESNNGIDSVVCMEGSFKWPPDDMGRSMNLTMVYQNSKTGLTFGTCKAELPIMSEDTIQAFVSFIQCAERDFGKVASGQVEVRDDYGEDHPVTVGLKMPTIGGR